MQTDIYDYSWHLQEWDSFTEHKSERKLHWVVQVAVSLSNLAILHNQRGDYDLAQPLYERALKIFEANFGEHDANVAHTLTDLAVLHLEQVLPPDSVSLLWRNFVHPLVLKCKVALQLSRKGRKDKRGWEAICIDEPDIKVHSSQHHECFMAFMIFAGDWRPWGLCIHRQGSIYKSIGHMKQS